MRARERANPSTLLQYSADATFVPCVRRFVPTTAHAPNEAVLVVHGSSIEIERAIDAELGSESVVFLRVSAADGPERWWVDKRKKIRYPWSTFSIPTSCPFLASTCTHVLCMLASFSPYKFSVSQGDTVQCTCLGSKSDGTVRGKGKNKQNDIGNSVLNKRFNFNHCLLLHHYFVRRLFSTAHVFDVKSQNHLCVLRGPQLIVQYIDLLVATGECEVSGRDGCFGRPVCHSPLVDK